MFHNMYIFLIQPGKLKLSFEVLSLNYKGLDDTIEHDLEILASSDKRKAFVKEIEKREPKKLEPSLFQQMLSNVFPNNYQELPEKKLNLLTYKVKRSQVLGSNPARGKFTN